jgi:sortase A
MNPAPTTLQTFPARAGEAFAPQEGFTRSREGREEGKKEELKHEDHQAARDKSSLYHLISKFVWARSALLNQAAKLREALLDGAERLCGLRVSNFLTSSRPSRLRVNHLSCLLIAIGIALGGQGLYVRAKAVVAQILLERAWEQTIATGKPTKAWSWADTHPVARISFPRLDRTAIVLEEAGGEALAFGPAHVSASPQPGANGTSVIGGHRDTHFAFIKDLKLGDEIVVTTLAGKTVRYRMTGSSIVHTKASGIATAGKTPRLALVTCYPFDGLTRGPWRYVVFAEAITPP